MRRFHALTVVFVLAGGALTYACSDDSGPIPADDPLDSGQRPTGDADTDSGANDADSGGKARDAGDAGDAGDGGDADAGGTPPHSVVLVRVGELDGGTVAPAAGQVFLDEYEPSTSKLVRTIALPTTTVGNQQLIVQSMTRSLNEGYISLSADHHSVVVSGYPSYNPDMTPPYVVQGPPSTWFRVAATVAADGGIDTSTMIVGPFPPVQIGGATCSGTNVWMAGTGINGLGSVQLLTFGNSGSGGNLVPPSEPYEAVRIFDGQLYVSTRIGAIAKIGTGLPTTDGQTVTPIISGLPGAYEFEFVDTDGLPGADRLYVAASGSGEPDAGPDAAGGVKKYVFEQASKSWRLASTFSAGVTTGLRGLTAYKEGADVVVVATPLEGDKLLRFVDTGTGTPTPTVIATAPPGVIYRGVTNAPTH
jgi:hypothetical protein